MDKNKKAYSVVIEGYTSSFNIRSYRMAVSTGKKHWRIGKLQVHKSKMLFVIRNATFSNRTQFLHFY